MKALVALALLAGVAGIAPDASAFRLQPSSEGPDLSSIQAKIDAGDYDTAIADLAPVLETHPTADAETLMGFALRKSGKPDEAFVHYRRALAADPEHKGALEYLGELYVETGRYDEAGEIVVMLEGLCPAGCEELDDLTAAIDASTPAE